MITTTKGTKRVNLHLQKGTHTRLMNWCRRAGKTLQDGLELMVETAVQMQPEVFLPKEEHPQWNPGPIARVMQSVPAAQAMSTYAPKSAPEPEPKYKESPLRVRPYDPQQNYCETRARGVNHEEALESVMEECNQRGIEWECTEEIQRLGDGWI